MSNNTTYQKNGQQLRTVDASLPPAVVASERQQLAQVVDENPSLQKVLNAVTCPPGKLLKMISKSIGPAEAEIEFVERVRVRKD